MPMSSQACPDSICNGVDTASHLALPAMGALVPGLDFCSTLDCYTHGLCPGTACPSWESGTHFEDKFIIVALYSGDFQVLPGTYPVRSPPSSPCPENPTAVCSTH